LKIALTSEQVACSIQGARKVADEKLDVAIKDVLPLKTTRRDAIAN